MSKNERKLSKYIDSLNAERKPVEHGDAAESPGLARLNGTVRLIRSIREPAMPDTDYPKKLARAAAGQLSRKAPVKRTKRSWLMGVAAAAVVVIVSLIVLNPGLPFGGTNVAYAMEQAYQEVKAYHGVLEIVETNEDGKEMTQAKREIWADKEGHYYIKEVEGAQNGLITANNGRE